MTAPGAESKILEIPQNSAETDLRRGECLRALVRTMSIEKQPESVMLLF